MRTDEYQAAGKALSGDAASLLVLAVAAGLGSAALLPCCLGTVAELQWWGSQISKCLAAAAEG